MKRTLAFILTLVMVLSSFGMLSVVAAEDTVQYLSAYTADGYTQPEGSGAADDPYQIASVDDLLWMAKQIGNGTAPSKATNPFAGKYFKQTADIDLDGNILPSIGFYTGNSVANAYRYNGTDEHAVFGGTYDGNDKKIYNGYVTCPGLNNDKNNNAWGAGLFGVIYGATIKNLTLENVSVYQYKATSGTLSARKLGCVGLLVGVAVGGTEANAACNTIENCHVNGTCSIVCAYTGQGRTSSGQALLHYRWGGLVGFAMDTTIKDCTNAADITVRGCVGAAGGLVGCMNSGVIENCVNTGNITVTTTSTTNSSSPTDSTKSEIGARAYGGLVGLIPDLLNGQSDSTRWDKDSVAVGVKINNSVNCGTLKVEAFGTNAKSCYIGGIIGAALELRKNEDNTYSVTNSYNMGEIVTAESASPKTGALIGYASQNATDANTLSLKASYSVDVNGTADDVYYNAAATDIVMTDSIGTKSAKEIDMLGLCTLYVQAHGTEKGTYRFLATINGAEWDSAAFELTLIKADETSGTKEIAITTCYDSVLANGQTVTDASGRKFIAFAVKDIEDGWEYEISASVTDSSGTYKTLVKKGNFG